PANQKKRVQFAEDHLDWTFEQWIRVFWTEESSFSTKGFHCRPWVIRLPEEEYYPDCIDETFDQGRTSRMAWGGFCGQYKTDLFWVPGKVKIDSLEYRDSILLPRLIPFWEEMAVAYGPEPVLVVEDGASRHKGHAKRAREAYALPCVQWPPQSPDLNLIEALWGDMEVFLGQNWGRAKNETELLQMCEAAWASISPNRLLDLCRGMRARLEAVIAAGGKATPYQVELTKSQLSQT
ncbi:hypothetical protein BJ508DRAFT_213303, partial [Ascobolus immersus RN42]